jgi:hypothetical protein
MAALLSPGKVGTRIVPAVLGTHLWVRCLVDPIAPCKCYIKEQAAVYHKLLIASRFQNDKSLDKVCTVPYALQVFGSGYNGKEQNRIEETGHGIHRLYSKMGQPPQLA